MKNRIINRVIQPQADYILAIVSRPKNWKPKNLDAVPPGAQICERYHVASYDEARDDLCRCNWLSLQKNLDRWAIITHPGSDI